MFKKKNNKLNDENLEISTGVLYKNIIHKPRVENGDLYLPFAYPFGGAGEFLIPGDLIREIVNYKKPNVSESNDSMKER